MFLGNGCRLSCPKEVNICLAWSPKEIYEKLSEVCFLEDPEKWASFSDIIRILDSYLSFDEKKGYSQLGEMYEKTRTEKYLKLGNINCHS